MAGRLSSGAVAAGLIGLRKPSGGGGGSAYDVTPPAATTQSKAAGASLTAHTFGAFGGADAGSIDGYTARIVNATGSTSWSGSGLGAWTPSADADGDAGVLALDATIGGVVVATALHDYSRAAAAGGALVSIVDWAGVSYNFLTTGGTGGSGGAGPHTVSGRTWNLTVTGSGPTRLELVSGVLHNESTLANRGTLDTDLGASVGDTPAAVYMSAENAVRSESAVAVGLYVGASNSLNSADQAQILLGVAGTTDLLQRECTSSSPNFTIVNNATITDFTSTPTSIGLFVAGGGWTPCHSQGSAALPTDGGTFGTVGPKQYGENGAQTIQDRRYLILNPVQDCDIRLAAHEQRIAP